MRLSIVSVLLLKDYLELMTVLEEDFVEVKAVYGHSLFYRSLAAIKRFTPLLRSDSKYVVLFRVLFNPITSLPKL